MTRTCGWSRIATRLSLLTVTGDYRDSASSNVITVRDTGVFDVADDLCPNV